MERSVMDKKNSGRYYLALSILAIALISLIRSHTFQEPLDADEALYSIIAKDWIDGGKPYKTLWDNKPIGTFVIYRISIFLFGYVEAAPKIAATISVCVTTIFLVLSLTRYNFHWVVVSLLLIIWSLLNGLISCHANGANSELFLLPFIVGANILIQAYCRTGNELYFWLTYFVLTLSLLIKQVTLPYFIIPLLVLNKNQWRILKGTALRIVGIVLAAVLLQIIVYGLLGYSPTILIEQFRENAQYLTKDVDNSSFKFIKRVTLFAIDTAIRPILPLTAAMIFGTIGSCLKHCKKNNYVNLYFLIVTIIAIALPGENFPHYYILMLPCIVNGVADLCGFLKRIWQIVILGFCIGVQLPYVSHSYIEKHPNEISYVKYGNTNWFVHDRFIGRELLNKLKNKRIFVDGSHPTIIFYSQALPATKYFVAWNYFAMEVTSWNEVFAELMTSPPEYCVLLNPLVPPFRDWIEANYQETSGVAGSRVFLKK